MCCWRCWGGLFPFALFSFFSPDVMLASSTFSFSSPCPNWIELWCSFVPLYVAVVDVHSNARELSIVCMDGCSHRSQSWSCFAFGHFIGVGNLFVVLWQGEAIKMARSQSRATFLTARKNQFQFVWMTSFGSFNEHQKRKRREREEEKKDDWVINVPLNRYLMAWQTCQRLRDCSPRYYWWWKKPDGQNHLIRPTS